MPRGPRRRSINLGTPYEEARWARLLRATAHVAPRMCMPDIFNSGRLRDAIDVIRLYGEGRDVRILGGVLNRLAQDRYGEHRKGPAAPR